MPFITNFDKNGNPQTYSSSPYKAARAVAEEYDKTLTAKEFRGDDWVMLVHEEGTQFIFRNAFMRLWKDWVMVFTEHHRFHVYHRTDLQLYQQMKSVRPERLDTNHSDACHECDQTFPMNQLRYDTSPAAVTDFVFPWCGPCWDKLEKEEEES